MPLALKRAHLADWSTASSLHSAYVQCRLHWVYSSSQDHIAVLIHSRPSCNTIREKEKITVRLDSFSYPDCGGYDARYLRRDSSIRP
jgi:hypothetical protein